MSVHVISWVLRESEATLGDRLVLLVLADHAKGDGSSAWPSLDTIAHESRLSERQARRCLRNLEQTGQIIETGKSRQGTHIYKVVMPLAEGDKMSALGVDKGGTYRAEGGDRMTPEPSLEQPSVVLLAPAAQNGVRKGRERNDIWDALETMFGPAVTRSEQTARGKVVASLKAAGATPEEMFARAKRWPRHFDGATLTQHALEKHWSTLEPSRKPLRRQ